MERILHSIVKSCWWAGSFGAHVFPVEVRELPKHVATNGYRIPDVIASTGLQANRKILMPFQLTQPAPSTRQITQRLLYF